MRPPKCQRFYVTCINYNYDQNKKLMISFLIIIFMVFFLLINPKNPESPSLGSLNYYKEDMSSSFIPFSSLIKLKKILRVTSSDSLKFYEEDLSHSFSLFLQFIITEKGSLSILFRDFFSFVKLKKPQVTSSGSLKICG